MISDEAVQAAARALVEALKGDNTGYVDASFHNDTTIDISGFNLPAAVRAILEAAAPILLSHERQQTADAHRDAIVNRDTVDRLERELQAAKANAWAVGYMCGREDESSTHVPWAAHTQTLNPYRSQA
jgi:hypothetical protein